MTERERKTLDLFLAPYREMAEGTRVFGMPLDQLEKADLIAFIAFQAEAGRRLSEEHAKDLTKLTPKRRRFFGLLG